VTLAQEPLGGACSTTVIATVRVGDFEGSAFVLDFIQIFKRIITFPVQNDGNLIGLMARIRQRIGFLQEQGKLAASGAGGGAASAGHSAAEVQMLLLRLHDMEGKVRLCLVVRWVFFTHTRGQIIRDDEERRRMYFSAFPQCDFVTFCAGTRTGRSCVTS
jgi:hypothetical protein